jgi:predicted transcriptional regulator
MHKSDIKILQTLFKSECTNEIKSFTIKQLKTYLSEFCYSKIHNTLVSLSLGGLVAKGYKNSRADTYYITDNGINILRGLLE